MRDYEPYYTEDGSVGLYSHADKDVFHSKFGALTEAWEKFVLPSNIDKILNTKHELNVLDVCYGIGYNTKALMSYVIDNYIEFLKNENLFSKIFNLVSIYTNNILSKNKQILSSRIETIEGDNKNSNLPLINIDCMDINEELIKLSPLFKTIKTPGEVFDSIIPDVFRCFDSYNKLRDIFINVTTPFYPKNKQYIKELLDLKFKNMHIDSSYKVNGIVNHMLLNELYNIYGEDYYNDKLKNLLKEKENFKFYDKFFIKYAKFNHYFGYKSLCGTILSTFLHNIYYGSLSKRYKNINFKTAQRLFNLTFCVNDARKSIRTINRQYDCIYLDAFSYTKAPQLWTVEFIAELANRLLSKGVILTYSNSAQIRNTLLENKLYVGKIYNKKSDKFVGTIASKDKSKIEYPLTNYEVGLCNTKAGIPYHDPNLSFSNKDIMDLREYEFRHSNLVSSSKYMKIRTMRSEDEQL